MHLTSYYPSSKAIQGRLHGDGKISKKNVLLYYWEIYCKIHGNFDLFILLNI